VKVAVAEFISGSPLLFSPVTSIVNVLFAELEPVFTQLCAFSNAPNHNLKELNELHSGLLDNYHLLMQLNLFALRLIDKHHLL
jgi:hypothetical protein